MSLILKKQGFYKTGYGLLYPQNLYQHLNQKISHIESDVLFSDLLYYLCGISQNSWIQTILGNGVSFRDLFESLNSEAVEDIEYNFNHIAFISELDVWGVFSSTVKLHLSHFEGSSLALINDSGEKFGLKTVPFNYIKNLPFKRHHKELIIKDGSNPDVYGILSMVDKIKLLDFLDVVYKELTYLKGFKK